MANFFLMGAIVLLLLTAMIKANLSPFRFGIRNHMCLKENNNSKKLLKFNPVMISSGNQYIIRNPY